MIKNRAFYIKKPLITALICLTFVTLFPSCKKKETEGDSIYLYYMTQNKIELYPVYGIIELSGNENVIIESIWSNLRFTAERSSGYLSCIPDNVELTSFSLQSGNLILNFNSAYLEMTAVREVLVRASLVKTYTQLSFVNGVELRCDSQPLCDASGNPYGAQKGSDFINPLGGGFDSYTSGQYKLYYPDSTGTGLTEYTCTLTYMYNTPVEQVIVEYLIDGEAPFGSVNMFASEVKLLSISTVDSVCYVNFNSAFLKTALVSPDVAIYSIVNSLTELNSVTKVQFLVNGATGFTYMEKYDLSVPIKRNLDFVITNE